MKDHEYQVGDVVFIVEHGGLPRRRTTVIAVKPYKRGPKVTCADGSEWDPAVGRLWGARGDPWYSGQSLRPRSETLEATFDSLLRKNRLQWALSNWESITPEQQKALGDMALEARRDLKARG